MIDAQAVREAVLGDRDTIFKQLSEIVSYHSVHGDPALADHAAGAARWVEEALTEAGLAVEAIDTTDGSTALIGTRAPDAGQPTVLLYCHHDVVPAGDPDAWTSDPCTLTERGGRWYGRGAADCKGNLVMHLAALRAVAAAGGTGVGLTVVVEGSEEKGGEGLDALIEQRPELFAADAIMIADTGNAAVGTPTLTTSLRGGAQLTVTVRTLEAPVHSGLFGGAAPDAVFALIRALDSLRDVEGRTVIEGVDTSARWPGEHYDPEDFRRDAGVLDGVRLTGGNEDALADFLWARPAVSITGLTSTPVDRAVNAVAPMAQAKINLRVPAGVSAADTADAVAAHLRHHVPWGAHIEVDIEDVNDGFATDVQAPVLSLLRACLAEAYGTERSATLGSGGSIPLTTKLHEAHPNAEIALFGVEEPHCLIHSADESVDPTEIERVAIAEALFLLRYGQ
ncbi:M20/M25/M40 family metallo-hydrolase [Corynebacterium sp. zg-331]|uniref:M20/M25/M40 family metallo-hydrolase n=1 Tax=unclassified Corynebacterium TaxID=2624378 RepID=UPI00128B6E8A|nr:MULTISPECIES: M20/M25/M40 family metallo-hydrolase [unclassified Corynebacterium]MBC3185724.1 M20/M25/M40 family metallo-hydrolase [Corynebacterium sp. zg-331]MPV52217.1 M20/M25/M40 family metallo-hydrolase [Corynebacterium sp. zg331]